MWRRCLLTWTMALGVFLTAAAPAHAYRLPAHQMTQEERTVPAEETLGRYERQLDDIRDQVPLTALADRRRDYKYRPSPREREALASFDALQEPLAFWRRVVDLKQHIVALYPGTPPPGAVAEADEMAKLTVQRMYDISQDYRVVVSALFHNTLINLGMKRKGLCYQYVDDLRKVLAPIPWRFYELHWGEAWPKTWLENNALVITATGAPFESGLAIDIWRSAGKPFWTPVKGDRFPWKEAFNVEVENP